MKNRGGCGEMSSNADWYVAVEAMPSRKKEKFVWFWQRKNQRPITENDQLWIDERLSWFMDLFTPEVCRSMVTITPDKQYFDRNFTETDEDAYFILRKVAEIMTIKPWEIQLMFFSDSPTHFSESLTATPAEKLKGGWSSKQSELVNKGFGNKEIWIEMSQLHDPVDLIATMSIELAKYKLMSEYAIEEDISLLADIASLVFGFGIFRANSCFEFAQWHGNTHHGWQMQKRGGLPEPVIAYIMAWLSVYRGEDVSWKRYLNRTARKFFEQSYNYVKENAEMVKFK